MDGVGWYKGKASCILLGNVGELFGGVEVFEDARPDDGMLELGVVSAEGLVQWARTIARTALGKATQVAVRANHESAIGEGQAESEGALRARRRRPHQGEVVQGQGRAGRDQRLRPARSSLSTPVPTGELPASAARATEPGPRASLVLGPLLRYVGTTTATVWVETDAAAAVEVLGHRARTFCVEGHHYALVLIEDLKPGTVYPYEVRLDGHSVWPPADGRPDPAIRTREGERQARLIFGSCRVGSPNAPPYTHARGDHPQGLGVDALWAYSRQLQEGERQLAGRAAAPRRPGLRRRGLARNGGVHPFAPGRPRASRGGDSRFRGVHAALSRDLVGSRTSAGCSRPCRRR